MKKLFGSKVKDWTVISESGTYRQYYSDGVSQRGSNMEWLCQCKCGTQKKVLQSQLVAGNVRKNCGCEPEQRVYEDLAGKKFGRWTVLSLSEHKSWEQKGGVTAFQFIWNCRCECGTEKAIWGISLRTGKSKQCKKCQANQYRKYDSDTLKVKTIWNYTKFSADSREIDFKLTLDDVAKMMYLPCQYCGAVNSNHYSKKKKNSIAVDFWCNGIDRIDSAIGYVSGNVVSCCKWCNWGKQTMLPDEYVAHCKKVADYAEK